MTRVDQAFHTSLRKFHFGTRQCSVSACPLALHRCSHPHHSWLRQRGRLLGIYWISTEAWERKVEIFVHWLVSVWGVQLPTAWLTSEYILVPITLDMWGFSSKQFLGQYNLKMEQFGHGKCFKLTRCRRTDIVHAGRHEVRFIPWTMFCRLLVWTHLCNCGFTCDGFDCKKELHTVSTHSVAAQLIMSNFMQNVTFL